MFEKLPKVLFYPRSALFLVLLFYGSGWASPLHKPPQIVKELSKQTILKYGTFNRFVLECRGDADPPPSYQWFKNDQPFVSNLPESKGITLMSDDEHSQLDFSKPSPQHEGYYYCEATNYLGKARSTVTHVAPSFPPSPPGAAAPSFIQAPKTELKSIGSRVELVCEAAGSPTPRISWTKNGEPVSSSNSLVIPSLGKDDVANYACNASNSVGYEYKNVIVNILTVVARIKEGPPSQLVASKGSAVLLPCVVEGYPRPRISWSVNGTVISDSDKYSVDKDTGELTVKDATVEDEGEYQCRATNHGEDTAAGSLIVKSITTIIDGPRDRKEEVFSSIEMKCEVVADMSIELRVEWKKDNIDLGQPGFPANERIYQDDNHSLFIKNISFSDSGTYTCVARNTINTDTDSGLLTVVGIRPELDDDDLIREDDHLVGEDISLPCQVVAGKPAPTVLWYKDNHSIDLDRVTVDKDNMIKITNAETKDSGTYVCKAENSEGFDTLEYSLNVRNRSVIVSEAVHEIFEKDKEVTIDCQHEVDKALLGGLHVNWFKDGVNLDLIQAPEPPPIIGENVMRIEESVSPCDSLTSGEDHTRLFMLTNSSLRICSLNQSDIGEYYCVLTTDLEQSVTSKVSTVVLLTEFPWWIIIVIFIILLILLMLICLIIFCKRRRVGKGYYGMDIEDGGKHNKSDIYYTTEDTESIMNEMDNTYSDDANHTQAKTPIFTPKTIRHLARVDKSIGSIGSLLDDDDFLDKGYHEDGSFRERYAE